MDFFSCDAGQCAMIAKQCPEGAVVLDKEQGSTGRILFRPTLMLAGHGLELLLKACMYWNGKPPKTSGPQGHDILALWSEEICEPIRGNVFANAIKVATAARETHDYPDNPRDEEVLPLIEEYVLALGNLHGVRGYPLRYPSSREHLAPRTPFLVKSLHATADDFVKRPNEFKLIRFRGED
ncbi:hypothetical protein [Cypionkella aquatica]|uniref:hypothetical protein n=1 Tax=Cypionkella aquatica TaxID=1756042 RepID=UPI0024E07E6D|nr:hypothetical protein [Cypionkella aquatica]